MTEPTPKGYWKDANGALIPEAKIKPIDKLRNACVIELCEEAESVSEQLLAFKLLAMQMIQDFADKSLADYGLKPGGAKGNITLISFDGRYKLQRAVSEHIVFDERLQAAKTLIDECIRDWSKGSSANIKVLVNQAFQVDKQGKVNTARVFGLRQLKIDDERWAKAMTAISDSVRVTGSKSYVRFYKRHDASGEYLPINLDVAGV